MELDKVVPAIKSLIRRHGGAFESLVKSENQLLEIGSLTLAVEHYRRRGYTVQLKNLFRGRFRVKLSTRGKPYNFSWYEVAKGKSVYEIHSNVAVLSAYGKDEGIYVVDVGVIRVGAIPRKRDDDPKGAWVALPNKHLCTFIEAKKLVIYPMLLAQFIGIVHEIKPTYLGGTTRHRGHLFPALVSIGYLTDNSSRIREGFRTRGFRVNVLPHFDTVVSILSHRSDWPSPFEPELPSAQLSDWAPFGETGKKVEKRVGPPF